MERALGAAGWRVCDPTDREVRPGAEAVRTSSGTPGSAFYLLYVDRVLAGLVAADPAAADLDDLLAIADDSAAPLAVRHAQWAWKGRPLPFRYATNGHAWIFRNALDAEDESDTRSRRVFAPAQPETVARWLYEAEHNPDAPTLRARLHRLPAVSLDRDRLYEAQYRSIQGLERSFGRGDQRALIQMATGSGKTYTVVQSSHRFLAHAGAHRVLFLVDRNNLGEQAHGEYYDFQPPGTKEPLHKLFPLKRLSGGGIADSDKIVITTIQRLWCMLSGLPVPDLDDEEFERKRADSLIGPRTTIQYSRELPPDFFDFIVIDECHRSIYGRWLPVLEYFDAHIVGLTATPIAPTFGFFHENLVSTYTFEEAVADKVNVDYDVYKISTRITRDGSVIPAQVTTVAPDGTVEQINTKIAHVDRMTRAEHWRQQEEDDPYTSTELNQRVQAPDQLRTVIKTFHDKLFTEIFPPVTDPETGEILHERGIVPKTLVFARDNTHADAIVKTVLSVFGKGDGFCAKITSKASRPGKLLKEFRNEPEMRIAVTVDMIATGTDIPALECLVFMRDIRTWSYFEQMKGRGARTIKPEDLTRITEDALFKDRFVIVDTVGVTQHPMVDARPLVRDELAPLPSLERLLRACGEGLALSPDDAATLAGRLSRLGQRLDAGTQTEIERHTGGRPLAELVTGLVLAADTDRSADVRAAVSAEPEGDPALEGTSALEGSSALEGTSPLAPTLAEALAPFAESEDLRRVLLEAAGNRWLLVDHISRDDGVIAEGLTDEQLAESVVKDWQQYVRDHQAEISALRTVFEARLPSHEVFQELDELVKKVRATRRPWTKELLWKAYVDLGIARGRRRRNAGWPEFISILRLELGLDGEDFRPYPSTVEARLEDWLARQDTVGVTFTEDQLKWLDLITGVVSRSATVTWDALDVGPCLEEGGGRGAFIEAFRGDWQPEELIDELDRELGA
ncbi:DEAD/DEAH box helicase family protein [Streptomyces galilaeus]